MRGAHLLPLFFDQPLALEETMARRLAGVLLRWQAGIEASPEVLADVQAASQARAARKDAAIRAGGGAIAVIPFYGVVVQHGATVDNASGGGMVSSERTAYAIRSAIADDTVSGIVLDIDSPGGSVFGTGELGDTILSARAQKPIYAVANSLAASAAYWVGSQATKLFATPGGAVGSIGVYMAHEDWSKALEVAGVKVTEITSGKFKAEGSPYEPLDAEAKAYMQAMCDTYYATFTKAVAKGRSVPIGQVRDGMGQGRVLLAGDALAAKMVDGIATRDEVIGQLARDMRSGTATSSSRAHALMTPGAIDPDAQRQARARAAARAREIEINS